MARLNKKQLTATQKSLTVNRAGGQAYKQSDELALASLLLTSFFSGGDIYYETDAGRQKRLFELLDKVSPNFAAQAAIVARDKFHMRTASHLAAAYLAGVNFPAKDRFFNKIVSRPDDMLEIAAAVLDGANGGAGKLPAALKRGFADALRKFDLYQLSKYRGEGKSVNIYDLINLVHPKPTEAISAIISGNFETPKTFETELSKSGQIAHAENEEEKEALVSANKIEAWRGLVLEKKIGYFALLRNLRNIFTQADEETRDASLKMLVDPKLISKSKLLPFRFLTAYFEIQNSPELDSNSKNRLMRSLSKAFDVALTENAPTFSGKTAIFVDESGSMGVTNGRANVSNSILAATFAFALAKKNPDNTDIIFFDTRARYGVFDSSNSTLSLAKAFAPHGGGTRFNVPFQLISESKKVYDRIIILSDMQAWVGYNTPTKAYNDYKRITGANPRIYSWDLAGYGDMQFPESGGMVATVAGWAGDKIFELIDAVESQSIGGLVEAIKKIEF